MSNRLHICQTCVRDAAVHDCGQSRGQKLSALIIDALAAADLSQKLAIRKVPCLSGCVNPCNVSFRASGKASLRFGGLDDSLADDVVAFAQLYISSSDGDIDESLWPQSLVQKMTARTPVPGAR